MVAKVHGKIVKDGNKPLYVPKSRYSVLDPDSTISTQLKALRSTILDNTFNESNYPKVTMKKLHDNQYKTSQESYNNELFYRVHY